jgi:translation initiation factor IF-2
MAKRLVKVANELNVGTTTIVDFLNHNGFDIENKPTSKITEEMEAALLKEFERSRDIKQKAAELEIGIRVPPVAQAEPKKIKIDVPPPVDLRGIKKTAPPAEEPTEVVENTPEPTNTIILEEKQEPAFKSPLKILGKIDLDSLGRKKPKAADPLPVAEAPAKDKTIEPAPQEPIATPPSKEEVAATEKVETDTAPKTKVEAPSEHPKIEAKPVENEMIRAETPQLKGLKILGKIDTDQFKRKKRKKVEKGGKSETPQTTENKQAATGTNADAPPKSTTAEGSEAERRKRKRKRKKVVKDSPQTNAPAGQGKDSAANKSGRVSTRFPKKDEPKEVSQKEIDDQIRATMARISTTGKNRRQKIRRDSRTTKRERHEQIEQQAETGKLHVTEFISVSELAGLMDITPSEVITACMNLGYFVNLNQRLDAEVIEIVASEFGHEVEFISAEEQLDLTDDDDDDDAPEDLLPRAPIVTVMGHVDHGKTSLLDHIRKTKIAEGEAGGITQHIGAYEVKVDGKAITFLDTPGHEAFTAMRARGAKVTDVAVIIVAADDSIMPQTKEAISHAQAAGVPMVFAINKIDKAGADPERIKQQLAEMNYLVEDWGGKYQSQDISAKKGTGIDELLEKIILEAEILDLKANPNRKAQGVVLEASLDRGRGYVAKTLVATGTLKMGDPVTAGEYSGKVKAMFNEHGKRIKEAGPSTPVLVLGLGGAPQAGEKFKVMESENEARQLAAKRAQILREQYNRSNKRISLDEIGRRLALGTFKELNLIVKGDVDGSVEALSDSLLKLSIESVQVNIIHKAVGQIIESDVLLASASDAIVIGFQVRPSPNARKLAEREGVQIKTYSIIYEVIDEIKSAIEGMLEPTKEEKVTAEIEVREVYKISKIGTVAGCYVREGKVARNNFVRVIRGGIVVFPIKEGAVGELASLKRFKEDVKEVRNNMECGLTLKNFNDIEQDDIIECYEIVETKRKLD